MPASDHELIARVLVGDDRPAFGELVRRHQSAVRRFLRHLLKGDHATADDLAQETFLQAYRSLRRFQGGASFSTWLLGIAHNLWRNHRRRQRPELGLEAAESELPVTPDGTELAGLREDLKAATSQLNPQEQLVLQLNFGQGLSHSEIATLLEWPLGTVTTHLTRGKERLRTELAAWNPAS